VRLDAHFRPLLMNDVGEYGVFLTLLDIVIRPIVGQLVARLLMELLAIRLGCPKTTA
jgi:hypothetical protein